MDEEKKERQEEFPEVKYLREHQHKMETDPEYRKRAEEFKRDFLDKLYMGATPED